MENQEPAEDPAIANILTFKMTGNPIEENISSEEQVNMNKEILADSKYDLENMNEMKNSILNPKNETFETEMNTFQDIQNEKKEDSELLVLDNDNLLKVKKDGTLGNVIPSIEGTVCEINNSNEKNISLANSEDMYVIPEKSDMYSENQSFAIKMNISDDVQNKENVIKQDLLEFGETDLFEVSNESNFKECSYSSDLDECNLDNGRINHEFSLARADVPKNVEGFNSSEADYSENVDKLLSSLAPSSPQKSCTPDSPRSYDSTLDENEMETASNVRKKNFSLPYFWLPNPDLEDFFVETEKKLQIPEIKTSTSEFTRKIFEPKDTGDIVFTLEDDAVKSNSEISSGTSQGFPRKMSEQKDSGNIVFTIEGDALKNNSETSRNSSNNEYRNLLASINKLDDTRIPGIKRLALKEYLKNKIEEKKLIAFQRSREIAELDEELEGYKENIHSESSTEDDFEEETVSFDKKEEEPYELLHEKSNSQELSNDFHHVKNGESDDDDIYPRKTKRVVMLEDDSSDESDAIVDDKCDDDGNVLAVTSCDSETCGEIENILDPGEKGKDESLMSSAELLLGLSKATVFCDCKDYFQPISPLKLNDGKDFDETIQISPIPSYQLEEDFHNEEFDVNQIIASEMMQLMEKNRTLKSEKENTLNNIDSDLNLELNASIMEDKSPYDSTPNFGLILDDPPISESENVSGMFSSQDLVNFCSGIFKSDAFHKAESGTNTEGYFDEEPGENPSNVDDLPQEKVQDYFDNEAELSGDDDGVDDDQEADCDDDENELYVTDDNDLPAEELRDEIADLHMKQIRDDDDELLKEIKEKFLDDGELNNDGKGRIRKYAWKNNDIGDAFNKTRESSSDSEESLDETWSSMRREKAKWRQENEKEDLSEELCPSYKKSAMKINIIGKSEVSKSPECFSNKRPRGSFLHLDDNAANQVLKKLKVSEDTCGGSRSTKHFLFLNDSSEDVAAKEASGNLASKSTSGSGSVFNKI